MPKNKLQGVVFGLIMSYGMAIGMEVYNMALKAGVQAQPGGLSGMTCGILGEALREAAYMGLIVLVISNLLGTVWAPASPQRSVIPSETIPISVS